MNKTEISVVVLLFLALMGWLFVQNFQQTQLNEQARLEQSAKPVSSLAAEGGTSSVVTGAVGVAATKTEIVNVERPIESNAVAAAAVDVAVMHEPEQRCVISNKLSSLTFSSWGGGIVSATLFDYTMTIDANSGPVVMEFGNEPGLTIDGIQGLGLSNDFTLTPSSEGNSVRIESRNESGLRLFRTVTLGEEYKVEITDVFSNQVMKEVEIPIHNVRVGKISMTATKSQSAGYVDLGVDTLAESGGAGVVYWGSTIAKHFGYNPSFLSCGKADATMLPPSVTNKVDEPLSWIAAKNKFFVQILSLPDGGSCGWEYIAERNMKDSRVFEIDGLSAAIRVSPRTIKQGETFTRRMNYYIGPKKYSSLKKLGAHQAEVMEFGKWFGWMCKPLLATLNWLYNIFPNYGVAIILLTLIVRIVFWPVTHKSTESMKKMQKLQPMVSEIKEKYKDKPQKMNQEMMELWKKNGVNPMAGCLPILVQIPVFFALFTVLRSAVELRYAGFLWVADLSEPEGLLAGVLPIPLNILPLLMTATTIWQQKLTPTTGDPQQQKMMLYMPVIFLFMFYSMASALVLYWTVSQLLAIFQLLLQRWRSRHEDAAAPAHA